MANSDASLGFGLPEASFFMPPSFMHPSFLSPLLDYPEVRANLVERIDTVKTSTNKKETLALLQPHHEKAARELGFSKIYLCEQIHGSSLAIINSDSSLMTKGVDGLLTKEKNILLGIHIADCGAVYLFDQKTGALALLHSGKKGTEKNITGKAVAMMVKEFGSEPRDLIGVLAPCIRPPHYEIDFASAIRTQASEAGIPAGQFHDCGLCTSSNLDRFYSYRLEKGNTGRMIALLGTLPS